MLTHSQGKCARAAIALLLLTVFLIRGRAEGLERIRTESNQLATVFDRTVERSPTFRLVVERIQQSDVIVHLTCNNFRSLLLAGRTALVSGGPDVRYVRVEILCSQSESALVTIVAHELQHVLEIASTPDVVDDRSFVRLFRAIGYATCLSTGPEQFETSAAIATGDRVRGEFLHPAGLTVQGSLMWRLLVSALGTE
jgi:uncharacterized protein YkvS